MKRSRRAVFKPQVVDVKPESSENIEAGKYTQFNTTDLRQDEILQELNIASENFTNIKRVGEGAFGVVLKAILTTDQSTREVALKGVKQDDGCHDSEPNPSLLAELNVMRKISSHPNVVTLIGVCSIDGPLYIVTEYFSGGTLLEFLRRCRSTHDAFAEASESELVRLALGVCEGMNHLTDCQLIHGDLSARNVLLDEQRTPKLIDFGMSRDYTSSRLLDTKSKGAQGKLPIKWMSIETLKHGIFTKASDVWSFGVLMWEIITLGGSPYPGLPARHLLNRLLVGYRMEKPVHCSTEYYDVMRACWDCEPTTRITFGAIVEALHVQLEHPDRTNFIKIQTLCLYPFMDLGPNSRYTLTGRVGLE